MSIRPNIWIGMQTVWMIAIQHDFAIVENYGSYFELTRDGSPNQPTIAQTKTGY